MTALAPTTSPEGPPVDRAAWAALAGDALTDNVFAGPEMVAAAGGRIEPADWTTVAVAGTAGRLEALAVVRGARAAPLIGQPVTDLFWSHYGPCGVPLLRAGVADAADRLLDALAAEGPVLRLHYAPLEADAVRALTAAAARRGGATIGVGRHERAVLAVAEGPAALGPGLVGRRRWELDRQLRKLAGAGSIAVETLTGPAAVEGLEAFIALEQIGWKGRVRSAMAADQRRVDFAHALVRPLAAAGRVRVDRLRLDGADVAVLVTLFSGRSGFLWKITYDERFGFASPGVQLVRHATEAFLADPALRAVDSLAVADHAMMDRAWAGRMAVGTLFLALSPAAVPAAERAARQHGAEQRLRSAARTVRAQVRQRLRLAPGP